MSVGNVLLRPQPFRRRFASDEARLVDLTVGLMARLTEDFARGGGASKIIVASVQAQMEGFIAQIGSKFEAANTKLLDWLNPYIATVESLKGASFESPEHIVSLVEKILEAGLLMVNECRAANVANRLNALADIVETDLGLSYAGFDQMFRSLFDRVINDLGKDFLDGSQSEEAVLNFAISRQLMTLRRLLRDAMGEVPLPTFNRKALIRELQLLMQANGADAELEKLAQNIEEAKAKISDALPLLQAGFSFGVSSRDVEEAGNYSWYASWFKGEGIAVVDRMDLISEPFAPEMGLGMPQAPPIGTPFLEQWAHWSYALSEVLKAVLNGLQIEKGNKVSPALQTVWQGLNAVLSLLAPLLTGSTATDFYKLKNDGKFQTIITELLTFSGSFEEYPGAFREWFKVNLMTDRGNASDAAQYPDLGYEFFLSLFTLINQSGENYLKIGGFTKPARLAGSYIASVMLGRKELYYGVGSGNYVIPGLIILLGGVITFSFEMIGWLLAGAIARKISDKYWDFQAEDFVGGAVEFLKGENAFGSVFLNSYLEFMGTRGSFWSGKTDKGKFGVRLVPSLSGITERNEIVLFEYPDKAASPYKLPFPSGRNVFCVQGHNDISSHHYRNGMIYAVDFTLQENEIILAMRDGFITDYRDYLPVGADEGKSYITIKHNTASADHDKGANGAAAITYARYEVAQPHGVRRAFAARGIAESAIIGTAVSQGDPIMLLGERPGVFETDYLQVWVETADSTGIIPTIPFVFSDIEENGIPKKGSYYTSGNTLTIDVNSKLQPLVITGWIRESGRNFVVLNEAGPVNDVVGSHLKIMYEVPGAGMFTEYVKIASYNTGSKKAEISGVWEMGAPPPVGARYSLGTMPYSMARDFDKKFAYLAPTNETNEAVNFTDGRVPDTVQVP